MSKKSKHKEEIKNEEQKQKSDVPILKNPSKSVGGRIVIWIVIIALVLGVIAGLAVAIVKLAG